MDEQESIVAEGAVPFHGIISRGLLQKFEAEGVSSATWHTYAHLISNAAALHQAPELTLLQEYAYTCEVLSFSHSAACVRNYLERYLDKPSKKEQLTGEVWNIKEGHTSSVWKVTIADEYHSVADQFVVNVARDQAAGRELQDTSVRMQAIAKSCPAINMAQVYDIQSIKLKYFDKLIEVVVTRNEFIPKAYEIHALAGAGSGIAQFVLVERFLTSGQRPSQIASINGRRFTEEECCKIAEDLRLFGLCAATQPGTSISINEGDAVWNGEKAVVIAIS